MTTIVFSKLEACGKKDVYVIDKNDNGYIDGEEATEAKK